MNRTLTISAKLYDELEKSASESGLPVEKFAEKLLAKVLVSSEEGMRYKREIIDSVFAPHKYTEERYGIIVDSVDMIREDRDFLMR